MRNEQIRKQYKLTWMKSWITYENKEEQKNKAFWLDRNGKKQNKIEWKTKRQLHEQKKFKTPTTYNLLDCKKKIFFLLQILLIGTLKNCRLHYDHVNCNADEENEEKRIEVIYANFVRLVFLIGKYFVDYYAFV